MKSAVSRPRGLGECRVSDITNAVKKLSFLPTTIAMCWILDAATALEVWFDADAGAAPNAIAAAGIRMMARRATVLRPDLDSPGKRR